MTSMNLVLRTSASSVRSECLGHTSERTTIIYLGQIENTLLDSANEIIRLAKK